MKHKKLLIFGIILILIGAITLSTVHNLEISKKENIKQYNEITKKEVKEELYKLNNDGTIYFKDKNLEKAIKESTKKEILTPDVAKKINVLILRGKNINELNGIEFFDNIKYLVINDNNITNIKPLENLKNIEVLDLAINQIEKIEDLKKLNNLKNLNLDHNLIKSISSLQKLEKLEYLDLSNNQIKSIKPLENLKKLKQIPGVECNPVLDLDLLEKNIYLYKSNNSKEDYYEINEYVDDKTGENKIEIINDFSNNKIDGCDGDYVDCMINNEAMKERMNSYKEAMKIARDFTNKNIKNNMSDIEKEAIISNYLMDRITYNEKLQNSDPNNNKVDIYYPIVKGEGVCHHYAQAFNLMAALAGLESFSAESPCTDDECSKNDAHEWNIVKIDNNYYHIDLTWEDDSRNGMYINLCTRDMNGNHLGLQKFKETVQTKKLDLTKEMSLEKTMKYFYPEKQVE